MSRNSNFRNSSFEDPNAVGILNTARTVNDNINSRNTGEGLLKGMGIKVTPELISMMKANDFIQDKKTNKLSGINSTVKDDVNLALKKIMVSDNPYDPLDSGESIKNTNRLPTKLAEMGGLMSMSPQARMNQGLMQFYQPVKRMANGGAITNALLNYLISQEGFKPSQYQDTDQMAIGYGFNLTPEQREKGFITLADGRTININEDITEEEGRAMMAERANFNFNVGMNNLMEKGVDVSALPEGVQFALQDLTYQTGGGIFDKAPNLVQALKDNDLDKIAAELRTTGRTVGGEVDETLVPRADARAGMALGEDIINTGANISMDELSKRKPDMSREEKNMIDVINQINPNLKQNIGALDSAGTFDGRDFSRSALDTQRFIDSLTDNPLLDLDNLQDTQERGMSAIYAGLTKPKLTTKEILERDAFDRINQAEKELRKFRGSAALTKEQFERDARAKQLYERAKQNEFDMLNEIEAGGASPEQQEFVQAQREALRRQDEFDMLNAIETGGASPEEKNMVNALSNLSGSDQTGKGEFESRVDDVIKARTKRDRDILNARKNKLQNLKNRRADIQEGKTTAIGRGILGSPTEKDIAEAENAIREQEAIIANKSRSAYEDMLKNEGKSFFDPVIPGKVITKEEQKAIDEKARLEALEKYPKDYFKTPKKKGEDPQKVRLVRDPNSKSGYSAKTIVDGEIVLTPTDSDGTRYVHRNEDNDIIRNKDGSIKYFDDPPKGVEEVIIDGKPVIDVEEIKEGIADEISKTEGQDPEQQQKSIDGILAKIKKLPADEVIAFIAGMIDSPTVTAGVKAGLTNALNTRLANKKLDATIAQNQMSNFFKQATLLQSSMGKPMTRGQFAEFFETKYPEFKEVGGWKKMKAKYKNAAEGKNASKGDKAFYERIKDITNQGDAFDFFWDAYTNKYGNLLTPGTPGGSGDIFRVNNKGELI